MRSGPAAREVPPSLGLLTHPPRTFTRRPTSLLYRTIFAVMPGGCAMFADATGGPIIHTSDPTAKDTASPISDLERTPITTRPWLVRIFELLPTSRRSRTTE
jgi:hypothetical protein